MRIVACVANGCFAAAGGFFGLFIVFFPLEIPQTYGLWLLVATCGYAGVNLGAIAPRSRFWRRVCLGPALAGSMILLYLLFRLASDAIRRTDSDNLWVCAGGLTVAVTNLLAPFVLWRHTSDELPVGGSP